MIAICSRFGVLRWLLIVPVDSLFKAVGQLMGCFQGREVGARAPRLLWFILLAICSRFCSPKEVNRIFFFFFFFLCSVNTTILKLILKSGKEKYLSSI